MKIAAIAIVIVLSVTTVAYVVAPPIVVPSLVVVVLLASLTICRFVIPPREAATVNLCTIGIVPYLALGQHLGERGVEREDAASIVMAIGIGLAVASIFGPGIAATSAVRIFSRAVAVLLSVCAIAMIVAFRFGSIVSMISSAMGNAIAIAVFLYARRKWDPFESFARYGSEGLHLGDGRICIGDEIVDAPSAAGLAKGPVLIWRTDRVRESTYREGKKLASRVIEGSAKDVMDEATEDRIERMTFALTCAMLSTAPAMGYVL